MPTTPASAHPSSFYLDDLALPSPSPSFSSPSYTRCSSEPPAPSPDMNSRTERSRSVSQTPSLPASTTESPTGMKSLPVTPKVEEQAAFLPGQLPHASPPTSPYQAPALASVRTPISTTRTDRVESAPVTPSTHRSLPSYASGHNHSLSTSSISSMQTANHSHHYNPMHYVMQQAALRSSQYTDLFLLEPHEYDLITDGELVRLYDRGVINGWVLEQIVDASIRIQRARTDADRAVSIKTRRAMIRQALED